MLSLISATCRKIGEQSNEFTDRELTVKEDTEEKNKMLSTDE